MCRFQDCFNTEKAKLLVFFVDEKVKAGFVGALTQLGAEHRQTPPPPSALEDQAAKWLESLEGL